MATPVTTPRSCVQTTVPLAPTDAQFWARLVTVILAGDGAGHCAILVVLMLTPAVLWYLHAADLRAQTGLTFDFWNIGSDKWGNIGLWFDPDFYRTIAERFSGEVI